MHDSSEFSREANTVRAHERKMSRGYPAFMWSAHRGREHRRLEQNYVKVAVAQHPLCKDTWALLFVHKQFPSHRQGTTAEMG